jgi:SIR2-like domain
MAKGATIPAPVPATTATTHPPAAAAPGASSAPALPCPYRQATLLQQALSPDKMRVGFFLGAGCPVSIRVPDGTATRPLIPNIEGLTDKIRAKMTASTEHKAHFVSILNQLGDSLADKRTVEDILTRVRGVLEVVGTSTFEGMSKDDLKKLDKAICDEISGVMKERLPARSTPYHDLAAWIGSIPRAHPVEIFTSNYDLLMEQALEESSVPYFDGFSGSDRTFFDAPSMEQDKLPPRWARLWKVHGSINWWRTKEGVVQRRERAETDAQQMIHPSHLKYDESRIMPYLAMQDRLRSFLARGQAVLVTCGYSFLDGHLNQAILDGLGGNPTAVCFGLLYGDRATAASSIAKVGHRGNLRLLGVDGGVLGTIDRDWHAVVKPEHEFHGSAVCTGTLGDRTKAPDDRCKFLLGDFKSLGQFLADQLARGGQGEGDDDAT